MGFNNVEFRLGEIEHLPVADNTVDVIISNCVVNLSPDKPQVFREAFRVLRSGGRLAFSDIVTDGPLPQEVKDSLSAWAGCVAGALDVKDYIADLETAGFSKIELTPTYFDQEEIDEYVKQAGIESCWVGARTSDRARHLLSEMIASVTDQPFMELDSAVKSRDSAAFTRAYADLTDACNSCHQALITAWSPSACRAGQTAPI